MSGSISQPSWYESIDLSSVSSESGLLVLVTIGKLIVPGDGVNEFFESVSIYQVGDEDLGESFDCVECVRVCPRAALEGASRL